MKISFCVFEVSSVRSSLLWRCRVVVVVVFFSFFFLNGRRCGGDDGGGIAASTGFRRFYFTALRFPPAQRKDETRNDTHTHTERKKKPKRQKRNSVCVCVCVCVCVSRMLPSVSAALFPPLHSRLPWKFIEMAARITNSSRMRSALSSTCPRARARAPKMKKQQQQQ